MRKGSMSSSYFPNGNCNRPGREHWQHAISGQQTTPRSERMSSVSKYSGAAPADIPKWLWLGLPLVILMLPFIAMNVAPGFNETWVVGEHGIIENLTELMLVIAVAFGVAAYRRSDGLPGRWIKYWILLISVGC